MNLVLLAPRLAKLAAVIPNVASFAMSLACHVQKIVPGSVLIEVVVRYHVLYHAMSCHAPKDAQTC